MDIIKKSRLSIKKDKSKGDEPPPYSTIDHRAAQQSASPQTSFYSGASTTEEPPRQPQSRAMPKAYGVSDDDFVSERRPRKDKHRAAEESEDSDVDVPRKPKKASRNDETALVKRSKKGDKKVSKQKRRDDTDSESEEEMIVTKTARKKALTFDEVDDGMVDLLCGTLGVSEGKVERWCDDDKIKWDRQKNEYDVEKVLVKAEDDEVKRFRKEYAKFKDFWQLPAEHAGPSGARGTMIIDNRSYGSSPGPYGSPGVYHPDSNPHCRFPYQFCGDIFHRG